MARLSGNAKSKWIMSFLVMIILTFLTSAKRQVHNFAGGCDACHLSFAAGKMVFTRDIDFLCKDCHRHLGFTHPSGMKPSFAVPARFPLDWTGRMTCATCHDVHGDEAYLLRGHAAGRVFCFSCHKGTFEGHRGMLHPAHATSQSSGSGTRFQVTNAAVAVDRLSLDCIGCHDSTAAGGATVGIGTGIWTDRMGGSHPIGVYYLDAYRRGGYRPLSGINPAVRLFDGRVGCGSCHNIFSKKRYYLTVRNDRRSSLCLCCHIK